MQIHEKNNLEIQYANGRNLENMPFVELQLHEDSNTTSKRNRSHYAYVAYQRDCVCPCVSPNFLLPFPFPLDKTTNFSHFHDERKKNALLSCQKSVLKELIKTSASQVHVKKHEKTQYSFRQVLKKLSKVKGAIFLIVNIKVIQGSNVLY